MSRRTLVRRLVAGGISLGAAIAYAHELAAEPAVAGGRRLGGFHFDLGLRIVDDDLDEVVRAEGVRVRLSGERRMSVDVELYLRRRREDTEFTRSLVGTGRLSIPRAGAVTELIKLDENPPFSLRAVKIERQLRGQARFSLFGWASSPGETNTGISDQKLITR